MSSSPQPERLLSRSKLVSAVNLLRKDTKATLHGHTDSSAHLLLFGDKTTSSTPTVGSVVIDIGARISKIGVVGELTVRTVCKTPKPVSDMLRSGRTKQEIFAACGEFFELFVVGEHGIRSTGAPIIVLINPAANADFYSVLSDVLRKNAPSVSPCYVSSAVAALFGVGAVTGLVVDIGWSATRCVPVLYGYEVPGAATFSKVGTAQIFQTVRDQAMKDSPELVVSGLSRLLDDDLLEETLYQIGNVAPPSDENDKSAREAALQATYPVSVKTALAILRPALALEQLFVEVRGEDSGFPPLPELVCRALNNCSVAIRSQVSSCIIIRGGLSETANLDARFAAELLRLLRNRPEFAPLGKLFASARMPPRGPMGGTIAAVSGAMVRFSLDKEPV